MAVSDLTNTKWYFNETPTFPAVTMANKLINFSFFDGMYTEVMSKVSISSDGRIVSGIPTFTIYNTESYTGGWQSETARTWEITGGDDATDADLIAWIEANATQILPITEYPLAFSLINITCASPVPTAVPVSGSATFELVPATNYVLPSSITVTGATLTSYSQQTGHVELSNAIDDVSVVAMAESTDTSPRIIQEKTLVDIANAVRMVTGKTTKIQVSDLADELKATLQS